MGNIRKLLLTATLVSIFSTFALAGGTSCPQPPSNCSPPPPTCSNPCNSGGILGSITAQINALLKIGLRIW